MSCPGTERCINAVARIVAAAVASALLIAPATAQDHAYREMAAREAERAREAQRAQLLREQYERRRSAAHARMRSEDTDTLYASTPSPANVQLSCPVDAVADTPGVLDSIFSERADGTLLISIGDGRPVAAGRSEASVVPPYPPQALMPVLPWQSPAFDFAATHADLLNVDVRGATTSPGTAAAHGIPFFPSASDAHGRQGIAHVVNRSAQAGAVRIEAVDDSGRRYGPLALLVGANETVRIYSDDIENGNADMGLFGRTGPGVGDWRLELSSDLDVEALSYVRSWDGVVSAMHDVVPSEGTQYRVPIFNPASDWDRESRLRLTNPGAEPAEVSILGVDIQGDSPGPGVSVTILAGASLTYTAAELESGRGVGLRGSLGAGTGESQLLVESEQSLTVMNLLSSPTGHLTNLSTRPSNEVQGVHDVPLFPAASDPSGNRGLVRVINRTDTAGEVRIEAFDDTQWDYAPLTLPVGPGEAVHFDSNDLEQGNPAKGLAGGTGAGQGDWRLKLTSDLDIEVLSYVRAWDGLLTSMHDVVPSEEQGTWHRVSMFNPYRGRENRLRLINPGSMPVEVSITGVDAAGQPLGDGVTATVPAGTARTYSASELAAGGAAGLRGSLGGATGAWQLSIGSEQPIRVMSLSASSTGHLTNLSTASMHTLGTAPPLVPTDTDPPAGETLEDVFRSEVSPIVQAKCIICHRAGFPADAPLSRLQFSPSTVDGHVALNLAMFEALVAVLEEDEQVEDPATYILNKVQGVGHGGGAQLTAGTDDHASLERFLGLLGEAVAPVGITPETLFEGVTMESARSTLRRAAIVFAGRVPTDAEYAAVQGGSEDVLRTTIRGLMTGREFHEFLIRASNDRLLTDRHLQDHTIENNGFFVEFDNEFYRLLAMDDRSSANYWELRVQYGAGRAPLELIAHVVENDLPYTDILTADYTMANPWAAKAYGASTTFDDPNDPHEFKPSEIVSYYRRCEGYEAEFTPGIGLRVLDPGPCATEFPHAGILNTKVFLKRYPTTATNRNRARARWTYYHFLGLDIEKSAPRTTDPVALADTNNPTMNNPACTVCHTVLDPVAGAFQNYGDVGFYRDQDGGQDSLDDFYKRDWFSARETFEITARSLRNAQTISVYASLKRGTELISLRPSFDPPRTENSEIWWNMGIDRVRLLDEDGSVVFSEDAENLGLDCGREEPAQDPETGEQYYEAWFCEQKIPIEVPASGRYEVQMTLWEHWRHDDVADERRLATLSAGGYESGETWYRDMREPGFDGQLAPNPDNSLQWLAQRIVADERFAEAAVRFWWPAIVGAEVAEPPEDETDADFEGLLLASNAQAAEVTRLASGFRSGFHEGSPYNLKDLLAEIVLSGWFRAESVPEYDPVRSIGLEKAGARRLLTPEELARKTLALTGFQWGRTHRGWHSRPELDGRSNLTNAESGYALLYGSIDSDGITERARSMTSVMAGVAQSHALRTSCPVVMKEFYLLPDDDRRLFGGMDKSMSPISEFGATFGIEADAWSRRETLSQTGHLSAGTKSLALTFTNNHSDDGGDRNVRLYELNVRDQRGQMVHSENLKDLAPPVASWGKCGSANSWNSETGERDHFNLHSTCAPVVSEFAIPTDGTHTVEVVAWADQYGEELAELEIVVQSDTETSAGAASIRGKLVELYDRLHGIDVGTGSSEVLNAYDLFVEVWNRRRESADSGFYGWEEKINCDWGSDHYYLDGIVDDAFMYRDDWDWGAGYDWDRDRIDAHFENIDWSDPYGVAETWTVVLAYLMMDYRYLYL